MRMRRKKNLLPRMERCAPWQIKEPEAMRGKWRSLLPQAQALRVELGCGKGRFTCQTAAAEPDVLFVAVERVPDAMVVAMERARDMELRNVFFLDADAANLQDFFAPGEVDRIYINFCDPWPANRYAKRRLTYHGLLAAYRQVLRPEGEIHFKTDNAPLFAFSLREFPKAAFRLEEVTRDLHANGVQGVMTDYEEKFHNLGTKINRCVGIMEDWPEGVPPIEPLQTK